LQAIQKREDKAIANASYHDSFHSCTNIHFWR